jgi:CRISPR type III-B/RAMP module RAMP protein Cmr6
MARIPMASDVAELIGSAAEKVENRSLLLEKFCFHKSWGLDDLKSNDAHRWTLMRISEGGPSVLLREAHNRREEAGRLTTRNPEKAQRLREEADIAQKLAATQVEAKDATQLRARHTRRFLGLFWGAFAQRGSVTIAQLEGRMAINLADSLIQNAGICLDRLFGLPFIPGSAIKGVCRHAALEELKPAGADGQKNLFDVFRAVFGTADNDFANGELRPFQHLLFGRGENQKGAIAFLPAYPVNEARVVMDLTNVHYPLYYGGDKRRNIPAGLPESLAEEKPQPNPFPAVESGAQFAFCLVLNGINNDSTLLESATRWPETALTVRGLGAKTASGYGWFSLRPDVLQQLLDEERREAEAAATKAKSEAEARAKAEAEAARRAAMPPEELARDRFAGMNPQEFATAVSGIAALSAAEQKGLLLAFLMPARRDTWKGWKKSDKPANKARVEALLATAKTLGITLP